MAIGLVKWWRTRFFAGYRPFNVTGSTGSDSEELITAASTTCDISSPPPTESQPVLISTESPQITVDSSGVITTEPERTGNDEQATCSTTKQLSFEEFECDVSVAEGDRRRQEFSFTLYDLDGHGKITKDDIAGLVTTIYDTLGNSIQVPPCGSKTIKVKLTVTPDQRAGSQSPSPPQPPPPAPSAPAASTSRKTCLNATSTPKTLPISSCCHLKHNVAPCGHAAALYAGRSANRIPRRRRAPRQYRCQNEQKKIETEDDIENNRVNQVQQEELHRRVGPAHYLSSPYSNSSEGDVSDDSDTSRAFSSLAPLLTKNYRRKRRSSSSEQKQQLLEIIQANMEKNNLSFHTTGKRYQNEKPLIPSSHSPRLENLNYNNQQREVHSEPREIRQTNYHKPIRESAYHHSISFSKSSTKPRSNFRKTRHSTPRNNAIHLTQAYPQALNRNMIMPSVYNSPTRQNTTANNAHKNIVNLTPKNQQQQATVKQMMNNRSNIQRNNSQTVQAQQCGKASKKHQMKHETREQDQARAMAQVVRWLEREFSQSVVAGTSNRKHVHEHIHHHYHHYHTDALV